MQIAANMNMSIAPTAKELKRALQRGTNCSFVDPVSLFFLSTRISLPELLQVMPRLTSCSRVIVVGEQRSDEFSRPLANSFRLWLS